MKAEATRPSPNANSNGFYRQSPKPPAMSALNFLNSFIRYISAKQLESNGLFVGKRVGGSNLPMCLVHFRLVIGNLFRFVVLNRPSTPLNDAQLGGYFFAQITRVGGMVA